MEMNNCCGSLHADDAGHRQDPVNFAWVGLKKVPHSQVYWCYIKTNVKPNMIQNRTDFFFNHRHVLNLPEPVLNTGSKISQIQKTFLPGFALMACALMNRMA